LAAFKDLLNVRKDVMLYLHVDFHDAGVVDKPNLDKLIHGMRLQDNIMYTEENKWTTGISTDFLNRLYNLADLYITPHGGEGFGLPICEAMACGVPFVATDCTSMPEFAGNEERGLLAGVTKSEKERGVYRPWVDMKDFVDKIEYLLENDDVRKKMGKRGTYWVKQNCSKKKIVPQWRRLFERVDIPWCSVETDTSIIEWSDRYIPEGGKV
jgi:glycosyltransferase involved in cell wall biosynthesis